MRRLRPRGDPSPPDRPASARARAVSGMGGRPITADGRLRRTLADAGKTQMPLEILNTPSPPTPAEIVVMRTHAIEGHEMSKGGGFSQDLLSVTRSHHDLRDGSGCPDRLKGDRIPDLVRLVTIRDIFDASMERRVHEPPMPASEAYAMVQDVKDRRDVDLVRAFQPIVAAMA